MKKLGRILRLALWLSLLAIALSVPTISPAQGPPSGLNATVINTAANPVPTQNVGGGAATQVGQPAGKLVNLLCIGSAPGPGCFQIFPDGSTGGSVFSVPSGQALVITDAQWFRLGLTPGVYGSVGPSVNGTLLAFFTALSDASGIASGQSHLGTGVVVAPGNTITVSLVGGGSAHLQGYLVPNQ
jgi:hypothetical protein